MSLTPGGTAPPGTPLPSPRRRHAAAALSAVVVVAVLAVAVWFLRSRWDEVAAAVADIGPAASLVCLLLTACGVLATGESWRTWLGSLGKPPPARTTHEIFYLTQSGKYLPGSLWPFATQAVLARRFGVPRSAMLTATSLFLLMHVVTGVAVGVAGVGGAVAGQWWWLLLPAAALGLVGLAPPVLARAVTFLDRRRGVSVPSPAPTWRTVAAAGLTMLLAWACYGGATWVLVQQLEPGPAGVPLAVGSYALAWVVGFLAVAAPAGVGAREAVMVASLGPLLGAPAAFSVALVSRVALTVVDLGLAAASARVLRKV